jgi:hypothetical protein
LPVEPIEGIFDPTTNRSQTTKSTTMLKKEVLIDEQTKFNASVGENIGIELGAKFVKDYYDQNGEWVPHFVGRNILTEVLNQPDCVGIKIYKALNEKGDFTYVITGANSDGKDIIKIAAVNVNGELNSKEGIVADRLDKGDGGFGWFSLNF